MLKRGIIILALVATVVLPFVLRPRQPSPEQADDTLVIITPHNAAIREEFTLGFRDWYKAKTGRTVFVDWRLVGGTSEITRYLEGEYVASFRSLWTAESPMFWTTPPSPTCAAPGLSATPGSFQTGRYRIVLRGQFTQHRPHAAGAHQPHHRRRAGNHAGQDRGPQSRLFGERPYWRGDGVGRGAARDSEARQRDRRGHQREYRDRTGLRGGGARLRHHAYDAGDHVDRAAQGAAGAGRHAAAFRRRAGHGRLHRQSVGTGVRGPGSLCIAATIREPG